MRSFPRAMPGSSSVQVVHGQVQVEDVDRLLPQETKPTVVGVGVDQLKHGLHGDLAGAGDPCRLQPGVRDRDVGVEARGRSGNRVDRYLGLVGQVVELPVGDRPLGHRVRVAHVIAVFVLVLDGVALLVADRVVVLVGLLHRDAPRVGRCGVRVGLRVDVEAGHVAHQLRVAGTEVARGGRAAPGQLWCARGTDRVVPVGTGRRRTGLEVLRQCVAVLVEEVLSDQRRADDLTVLLDQRTARSERKCNRPEAGQCQRIEQAERDRDDRGQDDRGDKLAADHQCTPRGPKMAMSKSLISTNGVRNPPTPNSRMLRRSCAVASIALNLTPRSASGMRNKMMMQLNNIAERIAECGLCRCRMSILLRRGNTLKNIAGMITKYFATSFVIEKVVSDPRVIRSCLPTSTTSISFVGSLSRSTMFPASLAACVPVFIATPTSASASAGASLVPSPVIATR